MSDSQHTTRSSIQYRSPGGLSPHPKNEDIYGDEDLPQDFVESINEHGVREPIVITEDDKIISGHRRHEAAKSVCLNQVPVIVQSYETELAEWEAIVDYNRQRKKTPGQIVREAETLMEVEKKRAKQRKRATQNNDSLEGADQENFPGPEKGQAREKAAEKLSVSDRTMEKGLRVKEAAEDEDKADEHGLDHEQAKEELEKLDNDEQSFHGAYENAKDSDDETTDEPADDLGPTRYECTVCGDYWFDYQNSLANADGETVPVDKVCIVNWPEDIVIHVPEDYQ